MYKRTILISLVISLAAMAWYFTDRRNHVVSSSDFIIRDTSIVDKIIFEKDNNVLKLSRYNRAWMVNDTFQLNKALVKRFLRVFGNLNLVMPISNKAKDTIINNLKIEGLKISVYSGNSLQKEYLLGSLNDSKSGNIIFLNDDFLAIINSTGLVQDLNSVVSMNSLFWRNRLIFSKKAKRIIRVIHDNKRNIEKSYHIKSENRVLELFNHENVQIKSFDTSAIKRYLSYFQNIGFNRIENSLSRAQKDSIIKHNWAHKIVLVDESNINYELNLYFKPIKILDNGISNDFDLNEIYGLMNNEKTIMVFDYYIIDPILKDIDYFLKE